jgi:hypothetical protein
MSVKKIKKVKQRKKNSDSSKLSCRRRQWRRSTCSWLRKNCNHPDLITADWETKLVPLLKRSASAARRSCWIACWRSCNQLDTVSSSQVRTTAVIPHLLTASTVSETRTVPKSCRKLPHTNKRSNERSSVRNSLGKDLHGWRGYQMLQSLSMRTVWSLIIVLQFTNFMKERKQIKIYLGNLEVPCDRTNLTLFYLIFPHCIETTI